MMLERAQMLLTRCLFARQRLSSRMPAVVSAHFRGARHAQSPSPKFPYPGSRLRYTAGKADGSDQALSLEMLGGFNDHCVARPPVDRPVRRFGLVNPAVFARNPA